MRDRINKENAEARVQYEIQRRLHPSTLNDFNLLCKELETWQVEACSLPIKLFQPESHCCDLERNLFLYSLVCIDIHFCS